MIRQPSSLKDVVENRMCTGCGACAAMAPLFVKMAETEDENRRPIIDQSIGADTEALLLQSCPSVTGEVSTDTSDVGQAWGPIEQIWEGFAVDKTIRFKGSSGGAVTALSLFAIDMLDFGGILHVKASKDNPALNEARLSKSYEELMEGVGSRYAPASVCDSLDLVADATDACVVIGKPCDIAGVNKVAKNDTRVAANLGLTISIFCAGTPSHRGTKALLKHLAPATAAKLESLKYRGDGWPGDMEARWKASNGQIEAHSTSYSDGWGNILQKHRQWRCHTCADHTGEEADISVGDPWQTPIDADNYGKSLIIARTKRGQEFLRRAIAAGYLQAELRDPEILFDAQPNLFAAKGAVWGRSIAILLVGRKALSLRADSFNCWVALPFRAKAQSLVGTFKRVVTKKLYLRKKTNWLKEGYFS
ncbi:Coenzyme F420 hydrogenase/dehydrogenase, beta subunit C-terminal domain [Kordiimonas aquimaris]|uniref:Coenzyme F420 hydrogenase/dehydrogenase, beta subunit C-terminal domain n=1 Tax=Kordiimonas aquimaris TaxID=707591 RepID=UPI0021D010DA|nr:Coenzyme F420 hydrogenase/dehydrogenase, beta subunit C-terminal domain [Kordiimonas aquimaris]